MKKLEKIVSITPIGETETIDISINGNNLFYANGILTHNCGFGTTDIGMSDIADSIGVVMTVDIMIALITDETLREQNQMIMKSLKNRFGEVEVSKAIGIDYQKMRLYDLESDHVSHSTQSLPSSLSTKEKFNNKKSSEFKF